MHMRVEDGGEAQWWSPCLPSYFHHPNVISAPPLHMFDLFIAMVGSCMYAAGALHIIRSISNDWVDDSILGVIATCFRLFALGVGGYAATARHKIVSNTSLYFFYSHPHIHYHHACSYAAHPPILHLTHERHTIVCNSYTAHSHL
mmetsp:Transcript_20164/g.51475  ORF Transcript_20164/g.51475 Transcript_20164/m.51475 type:complete len:145 (+) Transcript_20164:1336-1770(+)